MLVLLVREHVVPDLLRQLARIIGVASRDGSVRLAPQPFTLLPMNPGNGTTVVRHDPRGLQPEPGRQRPVTYQQTVRASPFGGLCSLDLAAVVAGLPITFWSRRHRSALGQTRASRL